MADSIVQQVFANTRAKDGSLAVLLCIAAHADKLGLARPSTERIAHLTGLRRRQVTRCIDRLLALHEIVVVSPGGGRGKTTIYRISMVRNNPFWKGVNCDIRETPLAPDTVSSTTPFISVAL